MQIDSGHGIGSQHVARANRVKGWRSLKNAGTGKVESLERITA
jgi:hypothetical protein